MKLINLLFIGMLPVVANATGMAVSINDFYLQNNTSKATTVQIANLDESKNQITLAPKSICKINASLAFLPVEEERNNFVIMVKGDAWANPVVIDQYNLLTLASDSAIKAPYRGNVKMFSLLGFCGNQREQFKFLNIQPHDNESAMPNFNLANCSQTSNFVYFINDQYIKVLNRNKFIDFAKVGACHVNGTK